MFRPNAFRCQVVMGVIGTTKLRYDIWGTDVMLGSLCESEGVPGAIHVSERAYRRGIKKFYPLRQVGRPGLPDRENRALLSAASLRSSISPGVLPSTAKC